MQSTAGTSDAILNKFRHQPVQCTARAMEPGASNTRTEPERPPRELTFEQPALPDSSGPASTLSQSTGLQILPGVVLAFRLGDFLEFEERSSFALACKTIKAAMALGTTHAFYAEMYTKQAALLQLLNGGADLPELASKLAIARAEVRRAKTRIDAERSTREKDDLARSAFAAARASWTVKVQSDLSAKPEDAFALSSAAQLLGELGRVDEAVQVLQWRLARAPNDIFARRQLAELFLQARLPDESIAQAKRLIMLSPTDRRARVVHARALLLKGDAMAALRELSETPAADDPLTLAMIEHSLGHETASATALRMHAGKNRGLAVTAKVAEVYAFRGELNSAFDCLGQAIENNIQHTELWHVTHSPFMDSIRSDRRWLASLRRMNRSPEQLAATPFTFHLP